MMSLDFIMEVFQIPLGHEWSHRFDSGGAAKYGPESWNSVGAVYLLFQRTARSTNFKRWAKLKPYRDFDLDRF
jgi:hypothetical protein